MEKRMIILLFTLVTSLSCMSQEYSCLEKQDKKDIIKTILLQKNVYAYLHLELDERKPIELIANPFLDGLDSLAVENTYIKLVDSLNTNKAKINLKLDIISCETKTVSFSFSSPIEGALVTGNLKKEKSVWKIEILEDIEF
ncbi:hypothetical protein LS482_00630 [Sinomicrobium kalidii]|uniref:hypothetical protein n=1 Tax=Sinomicrobium kalidii TaxID=2900738 RepID=UPI001E65B614|nr:hypothetical protein [Sinomicrobium kalidii]UGU16388.1 hypothetical protein LS482_00630 [Sinomicrobium kalidii]